MNNFILTGAILAFSSVIFGGADSNVATPEVHRIMCRVSLLNIEVVCVSLF